MAILIGHVHIHLRKSRKLLLVYGIKLYLVCTRHVQVQEGSYVGLAKVLFVARPPLRDMGMGNQARNSSDDSLIQL